MNNTINDEKNAYLIEKVKGKNSRTSVIEISVNEKSPFETLELCEGEIGRSDCHSAFFAEETEANMSFLQHRDVIGSVAYSCCLTLTVFDHFYNL